MNSQSKDGKPFPGSFLGSLQIRVEFYLPVFLYGTTHTRLGRNEHCRSNLVQGWNVPDDISLAI